PRYAGQDHAESVARNLYGVAKRIRVLMLPGLKLKGDIIDWLDAGGTKEKLLRLGEKAPDFSAPVGPGTHRTLEIGSDVEMAHRVQKDLIKHYGNVVHAEGAFWHYHQTRWAAVLEHELRRIIHVYDGAQYVSPEGTFLAVKLSKGRIDSIVNECAM